MAVMHGSDGLILPGLAAALALGAGAGALNSLAITALRLPPVIATLAWSFVFRSLAFTSGGEATLKPPAALGGFSAARIGGLQVMPFAVMALTLVAAAALTGVLLSGSTGGAAPISGDAARPRREDEARKGRRAAGEDGSACASRNRSSKRLLLTSRGQARAEQRRAPRISAMRAGCPPPDPRKVSQGLEKGQSHPIPDPVSCGQAHPIPCSP